jgi:lipopolysaccharide/colanic/teichoic acid biosynthesis glycosyltransferase
MSVLNIVGDADFAPVQTVRVQHAAALVAKRSFDVVTATLALALVLPLLVLIVVAICIESPGNPIFRQERLGLHGKRFKMLKLRSMVPDAERRQAEVQHLNEALPPLFKAKHDPRVTRIGRILRATSLDELPQLINVIVGDMSVVGPRPRLPLEFSTTTPAIVRRLSVKPGLAGLWQVSGRAKLNFDEALALDLQYVDNWSFSLDLRLIVQTIWVVLTLRGAY